MRLHETPHYYILSVRNSLKQQLRAKNINFAMTAAGRVIDKNNRVINGYQLAVEQKAEQRPTIENLDKAGVFPCGGPKPHSLIEISGAPNSGKSLLLWQLMSRCLPPTYFGGKYCDVILIDCSHKFDERHFLKYISSVVSQSGEKCTPAECSSTAQNCLDSLSVLKCYSNDELDLAFFDVEDILWDKENVALLAIDGLDSFYWMDAHRRLVRMRTHYSRITAQLRRLCRTHNICCAFTVQSNYLEPKGQHRKFNNMPSSTKQLPSSGPTVPVDYKLNLRLLPDGTHTLNERRIAIDDTGISFIKNNPAN